VLRTGPSSSPSASHLHETEFLSKRVEYISGLSTVGESITDDLSRRRGHNFGSDRRAGCIRTGDIGVKHGLETTNRQSQHVSVITLAEIQKGIELLAAGKRRTQLEQWLARDLEDWFSGRVLPVGRQVAMRWTSLATQGLRTGRSLPAVDSLIAATALA